MSAPQLTLPASVAAALGAELSAALVETMAEFVRRNDGETAVEAFRAGLRCAVGAAYANVVFDDLTGNEARSNAEVATELGLSRAAVSKMLIRCRRNLGFEVRVPGNARDGAKPKRKAAPAAGGRLT